LLLRGFRFQAEKEINTVLFTPMHDLFAAKAAVGAYHDRNIGPLRADLLDDPFEVFGRSRRGIKVRMTQASQK